MPAFEDKLNETERLQSSTMVHVRAETCRFFSCAVVELPVTALNLARSRGA